MAIDLVSRASGVLWLGVFAYVGVLIRIGLRYAFELTQPLYLDFMAELCGAFLIGLATRHERTMSERTNAKVGFVVGLCGCVSSFSAWQSSSSLMLTEWLNERDFGQNLLRMLVLQVGTLSAMFGCFHLGRDVARISPFRDAEDIEMEEELSLLPQEPHRKLTEGGNLEEEGKGGVGELAFGGALYVMVSAVIVFLLIFGEGGIGFLFTVLFAPLGCWGRWGLAFLNRAECWKTHPSFPWGSLVANMAGSIFLSLGVILLQQAQCFEYEDREYSLAALEGYVVGFCGSFASSSIFVLELYSLPKAAGYKYGIVSILLAQLLLIGTYGGYRWNYEGDWSYCYEN